MQADQHLQFVITLLEKLHIATHIITEPEKYMPSNVDNGLRAMLFGEEDYSNLLLNSPNEAKENVVYRFFDEYLCNYIFFRIPDTDVSSYFFIGPYIPSLPAESFIEKKSLQLSLSPSQREQLLSYYRNLPVVEDENLLISIVDTLGNFLWGSPNHFDMEYITYEIPDRRRPVYNTCIFENNDSVTSTLTLEMLEQNYKNERILMDAVSRGKLNKVDIIASSVLHKGTQDRLPDSLRNRKNYLIILNTLLRKAAEEGEVHPYHIHLLSSDFAKKIEELYTVESSLRLQREMIRKYCLLVKEQSLKKYSPLIGRVITLILYDLSATLTLKEIATAMNVNASYLSALFKKECGETLTDYVSRKRMENAAYILVHSDKQVQDIAQECGILDVNYFIKIFKKHYGITPTQYRTESTGERERR